MMRERFKLMSMLHAAAAFFGFRQAVQQLAPEPAPHDEFHHSRGNRQLHSAAHIRKHRRERNIRNEIAFQSRKRNRAN